MCKNCMMLPRNYWIHNPEEFFQLLKPLSYDIDNGHFILIRQTQSVHALLAGKIKDPFKKEMTIIIQCPICGEFFTCAYQRSKGAGFWNRNGTPF